MTTNSGYTVLGWLVWQIGTRLARRKMEQNRLKLGAAGVVAAVLIAGLVAARASESSE